LESLNTNMQGRVIKFAVKDFCDTFLNYLIFSFFFIVWCPWHFGSPGLQSYKGATANMISKDKRFNMTDSIYKK